MTRVEQGDRLEMRRYRSDEFVKGGRVVCVVNGWAVIRWDCKVFLKYPMHDGMIEPWSSRVYFKRMG